jgi:hypothetical protein
MPGDVEVFPGYEGMDPHPVAAGDPTFGELYAWADDENLEQEVRDSAKWTWQVVGIWYNMESWDPQNPNWVEGDCDVLLDPPGETPVHDPTRALAIWAEPAYWWITFKAHVEYQDGEETLTGDETVAAVFTSVGVERLVQTVPTPAQNEEEGPAYVGVGTSVTVRADRSPLPVDGDWPTVPTDQPIWSWLDENGDTSLPIDPATAGSKQAVITPNLPGTYELEAECGSTSDDFAIRAVGVKAVEWVGIDPGDGQTFLSSDNPGSHGGGWRLFAEKNVAGQDGKNHDKVKARATLGVARAGITVHFLLVDADDPTDGDGPIDDDSGTPGPDANGVADVTLTVAPRPGNNYRVVAATTTGALSGVHAKQPDSSGTVLDSGNSPISADTTTEAIRKATPLLTVWRRLHVRLASMNSGADLSYTKNIDDVTNPGAAPHAADGRCELNDFEPNDDGRFEGGTLTVNQGGTYEVIDNTDQWGDDDVWTSSPIAAGDEDKTAVLVDDDVSQLPRAADLSLADSKFQPAFIQVVDVTGGAPPGVPFVATLNNSEQTATTYATSIWWPTDSAFWAARVLSIHQGKDAGEPAGNASARDGDPDILYHIHWPTDIEEGDQSFLFGFTPLGTNKPNISFICLETIRDYGEQSRLQLIPAGLRQTQANLEKVTVAHELGHQFGLGHQPNSLMEEGVLDPTKEFSEAQVLSIRNSTTIEN